MDTWDELRQILDQLQSRPNRPRQQWPDPSESYRRPPFRIRLAPWATDVAAQLHSLFEDQVDLTVGLLHYPEQRITRLHDEGRAIRPPVAVPLLRRNLISVSLDEPVVVESGHTVTTQIRLHNHQPLTEHVATNGHITARVVDPNTGEAVGGSSGARRLPGITFRIPSGDSVLIPLVVGTASSRGELGYAIPPGEWCLDAPVTLRSGTYRTPPLPLRVIPGAGHT